MIIWDIIQVKCFSLGEHNSNSICIAALVKTTVIKIAMAKSIAIQTALVNSTVIKTALVKSTVTQIALVVNVEGFVSTEYVRQVGWAMDHGDMVGPGDEAGYSTPSLLRSAFRSVGSLSYRDVHGNHGFIG